MQAKTLAGTAILGGMLATSLALGEDQGICLETYRTSGLTAQQMTFEEFSELREKDVCAPERLARDQRGAGGRHA